VAASPLARSLGVELDRAGRVPVTPELTVPGHNDVFVIGDLALFKQDGQPVPGVAPAAMQGGTQAARNILRQIQGKPMEPFSYWDRGTFAVIGRGSAVGVALRRFRMTGFFAWLAWLFVHILFLIGFRSRVVVLLNWAYSYLAFRRSARIITGGVPLLTSSSFQAPALPPLAERLEAPQPLSQPSAPRPGTP
jgi:NADH dehydrogenase